MSDSLADGTERLFEQFEGQFSLTEIVAVVQRCRQDLSGSPHGAMAELVERLARQRLTERSQDLTDGPDAHPHPE